MTRLILVATLAATLAPSLATPTFADGKKGRPTFVAKPVPPLHTPKPQPAPPPLEIKGPEVISLPADFGTGGVGLDIDGGFFGGGRSSATADASASAMSVSLAYTIITPQRHPHHDHGGGGGGDCGCQ